MSKKEKSLKVDIVMVDIVTTTVLEWEGGGLFIINFLKMFDGGLGFS